MMFKLLTRNEARKRAKAFEERVGSAAVRASRRFARGNIALQDNRVFSEEEQRKAAERRWGSKS